MTKLIAAFCNFANAPKKNVLWGDHVRPHFFSVCEKTSSDLHMNGCMESLTRPLPSKHELQENRWSSGHTILESANEFYPHCPHVLADTCAINSYEQSTSHTLLKGGNETSPALCTSFVRSGLNTVQQLSTTYHRFRQNLCNESRNLLSNFNQYAYFLRLVPRRGLYSARETCIQFSW